MISDSAENLKGFKEILNDRYKGVYVKDEASARKYLEKHSAVYVIKDDTLHYRIQFADH